MTCINVCPLASELSVIKKNITCPEEGCGQVFQASSSLNMHLMKHHRNCPLAKKDNSITLRYFCPEEKCIYHVSASRHFSQMKYLKQHYVKVHCEKKYGCDSCTKAFATEDLLRHHRLLCGIKFTCSCGNLYSSYEALLTHSKRKQHMFDDGFKALTKRAKCDPVEAKNNNEKPNGNIMLEQPQTIYILPKPATEPVNAMPVNILAAVALTELSGSCCSVTVDKGMQTDPIDSRRKKAGSPIKTSDRASKRRASAQTQTGMMLKSRHPKKSTETQTIGDYILKKAMEDANIMTKQASKVGGASRRRKKSMETQTMGKKVSVSPVLVPLHQDFELSCITNIAGVHSTPFSHTSSSFSHQKDVGLPDLWYASKNSSGTQTSPVPLKTTLTLGVEVSESVIQTDLNLEFFEQEGSLGPSSNLRSLSYFEENSDSLDNVVNSSSHFDRQSSTSENLIPLEGQYSPNSRSCSIETQTELDITNALFNPSDNIDILSSTIETQTTGDLDLEQLLYSNMCTQTCEDALFSDLDFADIQTQTAWPCFNDESNESSCVSTETQTAISNCNNPSDPNIHASSSSKGWLSEAADIETQRNVDEFKDLIAEFGKPDISKML